MATSLKLSETVIEAVVAKLKAGLEGRIATINAETADDVILETPAETDYYRFGIPGSQLHGVPAIIVTEPAAASPEYEAESANAFVWAGDIRVVVVEQDPDRYRLGRKLLRQARAVTEVIWDDPPQASLTGSAFHIRPVRHIPGPVFEPDNEQSVWRAIYMVDFRARQYEGP